MDYIAPHAALQFDGVQALRSLLERTSIDDLRHYIEEHQVSYGLKELEALSGAELRNVIFIDTAYKHFSAWFQMPGLSERQKSLVEECRILLNAHERRIRSDNIHTRLIQD